MKRFLVLLGIIAMFVACDYASDAITTHPDVEITWIDPLGWYVYKIDTLGGEAPIDEVHFVPENSVDCYLDKLVWEYFDADGNSFFIGEIPLYLKIEGKVDTSSCGDTFVIYNIKLPLEPVAEQLDYNESAEARLSFIFIDEYFGGSTADTAVAWYGFYLWPDTVDAPQEFRIVKE